MGSSLPNPIMKGILLGPLELHLPFGDDVYHRNEFLCRRIGMENLTVGKLNMKGIYLVKIFFLCDKEELIDLFFLHWEKSRNLFFSLCRE